MTIWERDVQRVEKRFNATIQAIADRARARLVPYFAKKGWEYRAGNGTWFIDDVDEELVEDEDLPKWIQRLLNVPVGEHLVLGFWIRDIRRGK